MVPRNALIYMLAASLHVFVVRECGAFERDEKSESSVGAEVLIMWELPNGYERNRAFLEDIPRIAQAVPKREYRVRPNDTFSGILQEAYGVSESYTRESYQTLLSEVKRLNDIQNENLLPVSKVLTLPSLPRISKSEQVSGNPYYAAPITETILRRTDRVDNIIVERNSVLRKAAHRTVLRQWVSEGGAKAQMEMLEVINARPRVGSAPTDLVFAETSHSNSGDWLTEADVAAIDSALKMPARQAPVVLVIDDTWPTQRAFENSVNYLKQALDVARNELGLPVYLPKSLGGSLTTDYPWRGSSKSHAERIAESLEPLLEREHLVGQQKVTVVYIPIIPAQKHAREFLQSIVEYKLLFSTFGKSLTSVKPDRRLNDVKADAREIVRTLQPALSKEVKTASALISGVLELAALFAEQSGRPHFINASWTLTPRQFDVQLPQFRNALLVSASGNLPKEKVDTSKLQFVSRSGNPRDVLTVMNLRSDGSPDCESSEVLDLVKAYAVGFPGRTETDCGSSYSSPRVAWLLALREAQGDTAAHVAMNTWWDETRTSILSSRLGTGPGFNRIRLVPAELFALPK